VFKFCRQIVDLEPELIEKIDVVVSTKTMIGKKTGSVYRAISAEAGTKHGYMPSLVIYDELAQAKNRDLYDVLDTSFGARDEPLLITISTQSNDPEHILSKLIDRRRCRHRPDDRLPPLCGEGRLRSRRREAMGRRQPGARRLPRSRGPGRGGAQGDADAGGRAEGPQPVSESAGVAECPVDRTR
jgi:Phage Terminase